MVNTHPQQFQSTSIPFWKINAIAGAFLTVGLACGLLIPFLLTPKITSTTVLTTGQIIGFANNTDDSDTRAEIYSFQTAQGENIEITSGIYSNNPAHQLNDQLEIYYNPESPKNAWIKDDPNLAMLNLVLHILGGSFFFTGLLLFVFRDKLKNYSFTNHGGAMSLDDLDLDN